MPPDVITDIASQIARRIKNGEANEQSMAVLNRLSSDPRMEYIWKELFEKETGSETYEHPGCVSAGQRAAKLRQRAVKLRSDGQEDAARWADLMAQGLEGLSVPPTEERYTEQELAAADVFSAAFSFATEEWKFPTADEYEQRQTEINAIQRPLSEAIGHLNEAAGLLSDVQMHEEALQLDKLSDRLLHDYVWLEPDPDFPAELPPRALRRDPEMQNFALHMGNHMIAVFGERMDGLIARLASVAFDREIDRDTIREMLRPKRNRRKIRR